MLDSIKYNLHAFLNALLPKEQKKEHEFSDLIKKRHKIFWNVDNAETVRNTKMHAIDPIEKWKDVKNWQRKLSNKFNSREFAKMHNCKLPELYWKGRNVNTINFDTLPDNFVVRPTVGHSSGLVFLMNGSINLMNGKTNSTQEIKELLETALRKNDQLEFLIEEFLRTEEAVYKIPDDFKLYMFNGEVATIQVINRLSPSKGTTACYNENWQMMENINTYYATGDYQPPPKCLSEMVEKAKELSKSYEIFVRIDFYATDQGAVFGEFTPTPFLGSSFTPFANKLFIEYWDRYCNDKI